jgi:hypothetical protein
MKRALFVLLTLSVTFVHACQPAQNINVNGNANANANRNGSRPILTAATKEQGIDITYVPAAGPDAAKYTFVGPDPDSIRLSITRAEKLRWCITYTGPGEIKVTIDHFSEQGGTKKDPFDTNNSVVIDHIQQGDPVNCSGITGKPKLSFDGTYKYRITVHLSVPNYDLILDPQVIIDN